VSRGIRRTCRHRTGPGRDDRRRAAVAPADGRAADQRPRAAGRGLFEATRRGHPGTYLSATLRLVTRTRAHSRERGGGRGRFCRCRRSCVGQQVKAVLTMPANSSGGRCRGQSTRSTSEPVRRCRAAWAAGRGSGLPARTTALPSRPAAGSRAPAGDPGLLRCQAGGTSASRRSSCARRAYRSTPRGRPCARGRPRGIATGSPG